MSAPAPAPEPVTIVLAGGHPAVRGALRIACDAPGLVVVEEVRDPGTVGEVCAQIHPDVLVLEVDGSPECLAGLWDLRSRALGTRVLVLSSRTNGSTLLEAMRIGVAGWLETGDGLRSVGEAIRRVADGERIVAPALERAAVAELGRFALRAREGSRMEASLTGREREILALISGGLTMQQVGKRLGISPRTVETHVAKLYRKLGVRTRVQAVARAAQLGLLDLG